jgi:hypothetical protein
VSTFAQTTDGLGRNQTIVDTPSQSVRSSIRLAEGVAHYSKKVTHWLKEERLENSSTGFCTGRWFRAVHSGECRYDVSERVYEPNASGSPMLKSSASAISSGVTSSLARIGQTVGASSTHKRKLTAL